MADEGFVTRYSLLLFVLFLAAGCYGLAVAHGRMEGLNFKGLIHVSAALLLLSGTMLMWRAEKQG